MDMIVHVPVTIPGYPKYPRTTLEYAEDHRIFSITGMILGISEYLGLAGQCGNATCPKYLGMSKDILG